MFNISPDVLGKIFALTCAFLWAVAVILFKKSGEVITPLGLNIFKSLVTSLLFIPVLLIAGIPFSPGNVTPQDLSILFISGLLGIAISDTLFFYALNMLGAGLTAIVDCFYIPSVLILSWIFLGSPILPLELVGAVLVITAILVATLRIKNGDKNGGKIAFGIFVGGMAMFIMGISIILMKPVLDKTSILWVTEIRIIAGTFGLLLYMLFKNDRKEIVRSLVNLRNWKYALPGSLLGSFMAMTLWIAAFKLTSVNSAAILNQLNTIFIVILASIILKEKFNVRKLIATILGFSGCLIILAV